MAFGDATDPTQVDSGSYTPASMLLRQRLAMAMMQQGMDTSPIRSPYQGLARMAQSMMGGYELGQLEKQEKQQQTDAGNSLSALFTGGGNSTPSVGTATGGNPTAIQPQGASAPVSGDIAPYANAISANESGGNYTLMGPVTKTGDRAYGKYQVMGNNVGDWTQEILGKKMTPDQFLNDPDAQEKVFAGKFGQYLQKTGNPADAASMWFSGKPASQSANLKDVLGTSGASYVNQFNANLAKQGVTPSATAQDTQAQATPSAPAQGQTTQASAQGTAGLLAQVDPATRQQIGKLLANPTTRPIGLALVTRLINQQADAKIVEIPVTDQFGRKTTQPGIFNPLTKQVEPLKFSGQQAQAAPVAAQPMAQPSAPMQAPQMPAAQNPMLTTVQNPFGPGGQAPQAPAMPQTAQAPQAQPLAPQAGSPLPNATNGQVPAGFREMSVNVNTLPKPNEGFIYDLGPNGLPLFDQNMNPKMVSKAESDTRARLAETRINTQQDAANTVEGTKGIIADARTLTDIPGFEQGLMLSRNKLDLGIPTPFGNVGGDVTNPVKQLARMADPNNPAFAAYDQITTVQNRLTLLAGRAMLKGQGQVSNFERQMVADAIGGIGNASNPADYQFRLNSVERMIEEMNNTGKVKAMDSNAGRPTNSEIASIVDEKNGTFSTEGLGKLADKYNVKPYDLQNYIVDLYRNAPQKTSQQTAAAQPQQSMRPGDDPEDDAFIFRGTPQ